MGFTKTRLGIALACFLMAGCSGDSSGDSDLTLRLPFDYTIGSNSLLIPTEGGELYVSIGPYGSHFSPLTGHLHGDAKANFIGYLVQYRSDLNELPGTGGNGNGTCEPAEQCAYWGEVDGSGIISRFSPYIAPLDSTVRSVILSSGPDSNRFRSQSHWNVELSLNSRYTLRLGHLGGVAPDLRNMVLAATGIDTDTYTGPMGVNLLGSKTLKVKHGDTLAYPHMIATEVPGSPGYYRGVGPTVDVPWAQIEFQIIDHGVNGDSCIYDLLEPDEKSMMQAAMEEDMKDPQSIRYSTLASQRWRWGAEALLCPTYSPGYFNDFSTIHSRLGGWLERSSPGAVPDETFAIVKIQKDTGVYDPSDYDSPNVNHLVSRQKKDVAFQWQMPDASLVLPHYPAGEVLEETSGFLLIKWRDVWSSGPVYQRASYLLDSEGLKVKWGEFASDRESASLPTLLAGEECSDSDLICYNHTENF